MAEIILGSLGIETATPARRDLLLALQALKGRRLCFTLRRDAYIVVVRFYAHLDDIAVREELVETGHLTTHQVLYQLLNDAAVTVFINLDDVADIEYDQAAHSLIIHMSYAEWCLTAVSS